MANTKENEQDEIAKLRLLLKDKEDEIARLKVMIGTGSGGPPVSICAVHPALKPGRGRLNSFRDR